MVLNKKTILIIAGVVFIVGVLLFTVWFFNNKNSGKVQVATGVQQPAGNTPPAANIPVAVAAALNTQSSVVPQQDAQPSVASQQDAQPPVAPQQNAPAVPPVDQKPKPAEEPPEDLSAELYPFLNEQERQIYSNIDNVPQLPEYSVSAIVYSPSKAIINGQIVKEGDTIDTFVVLRIRQESVILSDRKNLYSVRLKKAGDI